MIIVKDGNIYNVKKKKGKYSNVEELAMNPNFKYMCPFCWKEHYKNIKLIKDNKVKKKDKDKRNINVDDFCFCKKKRKKIKKERHS